MKNLVGVNIATLYTKDAQGNPAPLHNITLITSEDRFEKSNSGELVRRAHVEQHELLTSQEDLHGLISRLAQTYEQHQPKPEPQKEPEKEPQKEA